MTSTVENVLEEPSAPVATPSWLIHVPYSVTVFWYGILLLRKYHGHVAGVSYGRIDLVRR